MEGDHYRVGKVGGWVVEGFIEADFLVWVPNDVEANHLALHTLGM